MDSISTTIKKIGQVIQSVQMISANSAFQKSNTDQAISRTFIKCVTWTISLLDFLKLL
jgi:hypothetical protein